MKKLRLRQDLNLECGEMESMEEGRGGQLHLGSQRELRGSGQEISD